MKHFYKDIPGMGNVAISRHAQTQAERLNISEQMLKDALEKGEDTPDGMDVVLRERNGVLLVILLCPIPYTGAKLVKTVFRVKPKEVAK